MTLARVALSPGSRASSARFEDGDALVVDALRRAQEAAVVGQRGRGEPLRVAERQRAARTVEQRRPVGGVARLAFGLALGDRQVQALHGLVWRRELFEQLDRVAEVLGGSFVGELRARASSGAGGVADRTLEVVGRAREPEMVCELGEVGIEVGGVSVLDCGRDTTVREGATDRRRRFVEDVADQRVGEGVAAELRRGLLEDAGPDGRLDGVDELLGLQIADAPEQVEGEAPPEHGGGREHAVGVGAQAREPTADEVAHALGQRQRLHGQIPEPSAV